MSYLLIENRGEADLLALTLMGASSKRDSNDKIGLFGTGFKNAIAVLLREGIQIVLFFGSKRIDVVSSPIQFRGKGFNRVDLKLSDRIIETGFTTDMGLRWTVEGALRDLVSNALDEENPFVGVIEDSPSERIGCTRIFIEAVPKVLSFATSIEKHFLKLREAKVKYTFDGGEIWSKYDSEKTRFYRRGVLVYESEKKGLYDYNIDALSITEERVATEFEVMWQFGHNVDKFPKPVKIEIVDGLPYERFESLCSHIQGFSSPDWKEILVNRIACNSSVFDSPVENFFPKGRTLRCSTEWEHALGSAGCETAASYLSQVRKTGGDKIEPTKIEEAGILWAIDFLSDAGFQVKREEIQVYIPQHSYTMGEYDKENKLILISRNCLEKGRHYLAATLMEEICHRDSDFSDMTRDFQTYVFDKFVSYIAQTKGEYL